MTKPTREDFEKFVMRKFRFKNQTRIFNTKKFHSSGAWSGMNAMALGSWNRGFFLYIIRNFKHLENILSSSEFVKFMSVVFKKTTQKFEDREKITTFNTRWLTPRQITMQFSTMEKFIVLWKNFYDMALMRNEKARLAINRGIKKYLTSDVLTRNIMSNVMPFLTCPGPDHDNNLLTLTMI
jgi:hypothetical protein|uniref:Uncharacterized protein n=1 Tax=viral metagenome TaxID=1070528 RepID=A0A6C0JBY1_9ZZZZ